MIGATLTTRLEQGGIDKSTITAFTLVFLAYNFKFLWAWIVDGVRLPLIGRLGQRVSWMLVTGVLVIAAVANLALADPAAGSSAVVTAAILRRHRRRELRHRHRRLPHRDPRAAPARCRLRHVAIWLAHRLGRRGRARAGRRRALRLGSRLSRLRGARAAGDAHRPGHGRAGAPPRAPVRERRGFAAAVAAVWRPFVEFFAAQGRVARAALHPAPQDRRHARQPHLPAAVRRPEVHQRRDRILRRRRRLLGLSGRHLHRRHPLRAAWA